MTIGEACVDGEVMAIDEETAHAVVGMRAGIVRRGRVVGAGPRVHPVAIAVNGNLGGGVGELLPVFLFFITGLWCVVAAVWILHKRVDGVAPLGVRLAEVAPPVRPARLVVAARQAGLGSLRPGFDCRANDRFHRTVVGGLRILDVTLVAEVRRDGVKPVRLGRAKHLQHPAVVVVAVVDRAQRDLPEVGLAGGAGGLLLGLGQGRQQHGCQDGNNGDDHQQLDQCEPGFAPLHAAIKCAWQSGVNA